MEDGRWKEPVGGNEPSVGAASRQPPTANDRVIWGHYLFPATMPFEMLADPVHPVTTPKVEALYSTLVGEGKVVATPLGIVLVTLPQVQAHLPEEPGISRIPGIPKLGKVRGSTMDDPGHPSSSGNPGFIAAKTHLLIALDWLKAYFEPHPRILRLPLLNPRGTPFQRTVWQAIAAIPCGETSTYGELATIIHHPGAARAVGAACGANPVPLLIPCHRVKAKGGGLGGFGGGLELKQWLLDHEGIMRTF